MLCFSRQSQIDKAIAVIVGVFLAIEDHWFDCSITDKSAIVSGVA